MGIVRDSGKKAAQGSAVGGEGKKKKATTLTPAQQSKANSKAFYEKLEADSFAEILRAIANCRTVATGTYNVGHFTTLGNNLGKDRMAEAFDALPEDAAIRKGGSLKDKALALAEFIANGGPSIQPTAKKGGKAKKEKIDPETVACNLAEFLSQADPASMTSIDQQQACKFVLECFTAMPAGKKDDAADAPTVRSFMVEHGLAVSGTKAILAERLCIHYGFMVKAEKPKAAVAWERVDNADTAELDMLEARIQARRAALAGAGRMVDAQGNLLA